MSDEKAKCDRYKVIRRANRGVITKLTNEIDELTTTETISEEAHSRLRVISRQLEAKSATLDELNCNVLSLCDESEVDRDVDESETTSVKIMEYKEKLETVLQPRKVTELVSTPINSSFSHSSSTLPAKTRLPKLSLPKFKGDVTTWMSFWDSYKAAIHENPDIAKIDKFNYLHSLLEGAASHSIQGLTLTDSNYDNAIDLLQQRFGRPQQIIAAHMDALLKLQGCGDRPTSLRFVYDRINVHVRGLRSLGIGSDQYGSLLIPVIMSKMPPDIRLRIARETKSEVWKIDELLEVIKVEVEAREASEGTKVNPHTKPLHLLGHKNSSGQLPATHPTTGSFFSNNKSIQCVYCQGNHYSASCEKVETIDERRDILIKTGRCFNCLKSNHKSKDCNNPRTCRTCHRRHHQSICPQQKPAKEQLEPEPKLDNSTISNAANSMKDKNYVLLQTAQAVALNDTNNKSTMIRVLFDSGSQRTYITESLKTKLNLKPISRERLHLNTFGNPSFSTRLCDVVQLCLKKPGSDVLITITALCFPVICSSLPDICSVANCQHLEGLELADVQIVNT